jgi:hypothetical protein
MAERDRYGGSCPARGGRRSLAGEAALQLPGKPSDPDFPGFSSHRNLRYDAANDAVALIAVLDGRRDLSELS